MLCATGVLRSPILYLSLYLKSHRAAYYDQLQLVRERGVWDGWLDFFLNGVAETAEQATDAAEQILDLFEEDRVPPTVAAQRKMASGFWTSIQASTSD